MAKRFPLGLQDFEQLRRGGYHYIDKTAYVHQLAHGDIKYCLLTRPRRFGKSLLTSTLHAYFAARRDLFEGLAITQSEQEWTAYPVLHLDFTGGDYSTVEKLTDKLQAQLQKWETLYGRSDVDDSNVALRFGSVIEAAYHTEGRQVVVLIDEYDKPLVDNINDEALQDRLRTLLKGFYGNLKGKDAYIRFGFLTGVSRFSKVSIFSDLNNLSDISLSPRYAAICGITEQELTENFKPEIQALAAARQFTYEDTLCRLRTLYDGYHFAWPSPGVYNPFSLLTSLSEGTFSRQWFETGTPTFLIRLLQEGDYSLHEVAHTLTDASDLIAKDTLSRSVIAMLYQTGYLTIKGWDDSLELLRLGLPNKEVEEGFFKFLLPMYTYDRINTPYEVACFKKEIREGNVDGFMRRLTAFFARIPYDAIHGDCERHYQNVIFTIFLLLGCQTDEEYHTSEGRIDCLVESASYIFIFEFKTDGRGTPDDALAQIDRNHYAAPFLASNKQIRRIGVVFSKKKRGIGAWKQA